MRRPKNLPIELRPKMYSIAGSPSFRALWNPNTCSYDIEMRDKDGREDVETGIRSNTRAVARLNELQTVSNEIARSR